MIKNTDFPKAGVILLRPSEIIHYGYPEVPITSPLDAHLFHYRPGYVILERTDIEAYVAALRNGSTSLSLMEYYQNKGVICRADLSGLDLSGVNFSGVDFSGSVLSRTKLNRSIFENAYLVGVNMDNAEVEEVNFSNANLSLIHAEQTIFRRSNFVGAKIFYSYFLNTDMTNILFLGSDWHGSNLTSVRTDDETSTALENLKTATIDLINHQNSQETFLLQLQTQISESQREQERRMDELQANLSQVQSEVRSQSAEHSVAIKLRKLGERVLNDQDMQTELSLYIPVQAAKNRNTGERFDLEHEVSHFLASDKKVMLLLGEAGEGKSTFNRYLLRKLWTQFQEGSAIPIFISLPNIRNPDTELLTEYFHSEGFTDEETALLQTRYSFIFILDGYDEMKTTPNLYKTNQLGNWQAKVIISCRTQYITQFVRYHRHFKPIQGDRLLDDAFQEMTVVSFNEDQIGAYIAKYLENHSETEWRDPAIYHTHINNISGLKDLVTTPFLLMIALEVMPSIVEKYSEQEEGIRKKVTQNTLYDEFMQLWFERGEIKILSHSSSSIFGWNDIVKAFQNISEELAKEMFHADVMQVHYQTSEEKSDEVYRDYFQDHKLDSITLAELDNLSLEENTLHLVYVEDCIEPTEKWRIVARNNAGSPTYNIKTGWLTVAELARRWSLRDQNIQEHQEKVHRLNHALDILNLHTPETLTLDMTQEIFEAVLLGLTHNWDRFFNLNNPNVRKILPGIPVRNTGRGNNYAFIHAEIFRYFVAKAVKREELRNASTAKTKKSWKSSHRIAPLAAELGFLPNPSMLAYPENKTEQPNSNFKQGA